MHESGTGTREEPVELVVQIWVELVSDPMGRIEDLTLQCKPY